MSSKNQERAVRYRRLALAETDKARAALLFRIADEAERGVLCTPDQVRNPVIPDTKAPQAS